MAIFNKKNSDIATDNYYIKSLILSVVTYLNNFLISCRSAAKQDDGVVDEGEEKVLKEIERLTKQYLDDLRGLSK